MDIEKIKNDIVDFKITDNISLEKFRLTFLSKKGIIPSLFSELRNVPKEQKKEAGQKINDLKKLILKEIKNAGKLDIVLLGLHGAMIAKNCVDCEGDLVKNIRKIVGPDVVIGVTFDPHSHLSKKFITNTNILTVFKEFPHTDFEETAKNCINLSIKKFNKNIKPKISVFDVKMMTILPTSKEPMRSFIDKIKLLENKNPLLSISITFTFTS